MKLVSVIIPLHNKGPYVAETLASLQSQQMSDWEAIVVENGSNDDGPKVVAKMAALDNRIQLIYAGEDVRGPSRARNLGLKQTGGEWILFLDADDLIDPHYLETMLCRAHKVPSAVVVAAPWKEFLAGSAFEGGVTKYPAGMERRGQEVESYAVAHTCWAVHAAIVRRSWLEGREWPEEMDGFLAEDTAFWFRVVFGATVAYSDFPGAFYRTQTANCRSDYTAEAWFQGNHRAVLSNLEFLARAGLEPSRGQIEALVRHYEALHRRAQCSGSQETAHQALAEARGWMQQLGKAGGSKRTSMRLRSLLGLLLFARLQRIVAQFSKFYKV